MDVEEPVTTASKPDPQHLTYLWTEYKYRHELCWTAVYKVSVAVIALAAIPYAKAAIPNEFRGWLVAPPLIGTILAAFGILFVWSELDLFAKVKLAHHTLQDQFFDATLSDADIRGAAKHGLTVRKAWRTPFDWYVMVFMVALLLLSGGHVLFLRMSYILKSTPICSL